MVLNHTRMDHSVFTHTLNIFEQFYRKVREYIPRELREEMEAILADEMNLERMTLEELEDVMIACGRRAWAYRKAYNDVERMLEERVGESFLLQRLTPNMKRAYHSFAAVGGTIKELRSGSPAAYFTSAERVKLCEAFVEMEQDVDRFSLQAIHSTEVKFFTEKLREYTLLLNEIEAQMDVLRAMAEKESEHKQLHDEILAQVRGFEFGFCFLAEETEHAAVCRAVEHFSGRKKEMLR